MFLHNGIINDLNDEDGGLFREDSHAVRIRLSTPRNQTKRGGSPEKVCWILWLVPKLELTVIHLGKELELQYCGEWEDRQGLHHSRNSRQDTEHRLTGWNQSFIRMDGKARVKDGDESE